MKHLLFFIPILFISNCCLTTSADCNCVPPDPVLTDEALAWIAPYVNATSFVYQNTLGDFDTLQVSQISDTEFCGGDECGSNCQQEKTTLTSNSNPSLRLHLKANNNVDFHINEQQNDGEYLFAGIQVVNNRAFQVNTQASVTIDESFDWNGETMTVLKATCENDLSCDGYEMKSFIVSKTKGLLQYTAKNDIEWIIVE